MTEPIRFIADRNAYIRSHTWMAALGMGGAMAILWVIGNPHVWTGAIAGLAAITLRGWYLASEELAVVWVIEDERIKGPMERNIALSDIAKLRTLGSMVQIITHGGDKHLIKYQSDPQATVARIEAARR
ncbi:hypothetical protein [Aestuariivita sp.]|jgi:hypothetical protein|uniref:hypothetical protein n=1 Tax=Aestuariivita sp. TaxID=1872407 RepID=UPI0021716D32|nr:hypothetical protein [Aestuariivita sp.]MCE8009197.1 hypothetical protein [Aestuariivita sp.]